MIVHLIDGTYELFRHFYGLRRFHKTDPPFGAVSGVLNTVAKMIEDGATHVGVATDHIIESFRNDLWPGYKTSAGMERALLAQFHPLEDALVATGIVVWPMVEFEADDALASAAARAAQDSQVEQVLICTPDKDLAQSVSGTRVVQVDRRRELVRDEAGVEAKFGVNPSSIPDYLALTGDSADGYPGITGWGTKAAAAVLSHYPRLESIPKNWNDWDPSIKRARGLPGALFAAWEDALLFRTLATLRLDVPVFNSVDELRWNGCRPDFDDKCKRIKAPDLYRRVSAKSLSPSQS